MSSARRVVAVVLVLPADVCWDHPVARYVAFLRAVNVGRRTVAMARARELLVELGLEDVSSFVTSGNLLFSSPRRAATLERAVRAALEGEWGFEIGTVVRTADEVREMLAARPFGDVEPGHTHQVLLCLEPLTVEQQRAAEALSNDTDEVRVHGRDLHWLVRGKTLDTSLTPAQWRRALPGVTTTARNTTMLARLARLC